MKKYLIILLLLFVNLNAETTDNREQLLRFTKPMVNIFEVYQKHENIRLENLVIDDGKIEFTQEDSVYVYSFDKKIGANFSTYPRITNLLNIYAENDNVYYIEALRFSDIFSVDINTGVHFSKKTFYNAIGVNLIYQKNADLEFGVGISDFTSFRQTNLTFYCDYTQFQIMNLIAGINLHKQRKMKDLGESFDFPKDNNQYKLDKGFYSTFFINPGVEFHSGKLSIRQGIEMDFILLMGEEFGIAHQLKAVLQLNYRLF